MNEIRMMAVIGGDGTMGSQSGSLFAQAGVRCVFCAPSLEEARAGIERAVEQARSDVVRAYLEPATFDSLSRVLPECDWILEAVSEDLALKRQFFKEVDACRKEGSIVSTMSSSLSVEDIVRDCGDDLKAHSMNVHFFNPPAKLPANELIFHPLNAEDLRQFVNRFCRNELRRINVVAHNRPGFAANRIGFQFLNEAARHAERWGVEIIDYLLGPFTGRALPPLATIDLVGLDVHEAIVENIHRGTSDERHETFTVPPYLHEMVKRKLLGRKSGKGGGFHRIDENKVRYVFDPASLEYRKRENPNIDTIERIKSRIRDGEYRKAVDLIMRGDSEPFSLVRYFIADYIAYSYSRVGEVTPAEDGIHGIDRLMAYGFSWLPPSAWIDYLGGRAEAVDLLKGSGLAVPEALMEAAIADRCRIPEVGQYFLAR
jgi:3-hydroxyacyl-CoA dehydrogenase